MGSAWTYGSTADNDIKQDGKWWATALSKSEAKKIVEQFDAYEAQIAELEAALTGEVEENMRWRGRFDGDVNENVAQEICDLNNKATELTAELAHVKAESLRVVVEGSKCRAEDLQANVNFAICREQIVMPEPHVWGWVALDGSYPCIGPDDEAIEVRLERWEKEE